MEMRDVTVIFLSTHGVSPTVGRSCPFESLDNVDKTGEKSVFRFLKAFMSGLHCNPWK